MSIPSICSLRRLRTAAPAVLLLALGGCTYGAGQLLFMMGAGRGELIQPEFVLTDGPVLIFVDDYHEELTWPLTSRYLFEELSQELLRNEAAEKIIPLETLDSTRATRADFGKLSAREIGALCEADQMIWIEVRDFLAEPSVYAATEAAYFRVTVKVLDPNETKRRSRVRLWPASPSGHPVEVSLSGARVAELKVRAAVAKLLADELSVKIAKLFYEHRLGDFESKE